MYFDFARYPVFGEHNADELRQEWEAAGEPEYRVKGPITEPKTELGRKLLQVRDWYNSESWPFRSKTKPLKFKAKSAAVMKLFANDETMFSIDTHKYMIVIPLETIRYVDEYDMRIRSKIPLKKGEVLIAGGADNREDFYLIGAKDHRTPVVILE